MDVQGKVVAVTGAARGLGQACALACANAGADIALRTTILVGPDGRERWRRVSHSVPDIPSWDDTLSMIKQSVQ